MRPVDGDGNGTARCDIGAFELGASVSAPPPSGNPGVLQFTTSAETKPESGGFLSGFIRVFVERVGGTFGAVSAYVTPSPGTATANSDYNPTPILVTWAEGEGISGPGVSKEVLIEIVNDTIAEPAETFTIGLTNITGGATVGSPATVTATITNDDAASPPSPGSFSIFAFGSIDVNESTPFATVIVSRSGGSSGAVTVNYSTSPGTALAGSDYQTTSGTLSWADGDATEKSFTVPIVDDTAVDPDERFTVTLTTPTGGATLGSTSSMDVRIIDNDAPNPGAVQFSSATFSAMEGAGTVTVTVSRVGGSLGTARVDLRSSAGSARFDDDFTPTGTRLLTWNSGDASTKSVTINLTNDDVLEPNETFTITLSNPGGATLGLPDTATVTIVDDDATATAALPGTLQFSATSSSVAENGGPITVMVTRSGGSAGAVSVQYSTSANTAAAGSDFGSASGTLSWPDGDTTPKTFTVAITDDTAAEASETFTVTLTNATGGSPIGLPSTTTVTITDNDTGAPPAPAGTLQFSAASYAASEGGAAVTVSVTRIGGTGGAVSVQYATSPETALAGTDYQTATGTLSWADAEAASKTFTVTIIDDALVESSESFSVTLSAPAGGATLGVPATASVVISDNDTTPGPAGTLQFSAAVSSVEEAGGVVTLGVTRSGGSAGIVTVQYATSPGAAQAGSDYQTASGTLTWASGDTEQKTFTVTIIDDAVPDSGETFAVTLSNPAGGATVGTPSTATVTIVDNDTATAANIPTASGWILILLVMTLAAAGSWLAGRS